MDDNQKISGVKNIMVIEDDKFLRDLLVGRLGREGYRVISFISATEALEAIDGSRPNIIMLDLVLPGMDGYEALKILKENPKTADIPVMVLSNLGQKEEVDKALKLGAESFLIKANFTPSEIVAKIQALIGKEST